jgi:hypothetical protein
MAGIKKRLKKFLGIGATEADTVIVKLPPEETTPEKIEEFRSRFESEVGHGHCMPEKIIFAPPHPLLLPTERAAEILEGRIATEYDMRGELTRLVEQLGNQKKTAARLGISKQYLGDVLIGRRPVSSPLAARLGYQKVEVFIQNKQ